MKRLSLVGLLMIAASAVFAQGGKVDTWTAFAKTKFEPKYYEKLGEYLFYPNFTPELKALEGKEVSIQGYYIPFAPDDSEYIILSKFPQSQCFFCGGGGPESIVEINFAKNPSKFQVDDFVTVKGKLKLNAEDQDHVNFILTDAVLVSR